MSRIARWKRGKTMKNQQNQFINVRALHLAGVALLLFPVSSRAQDSGKSFPIEMNPTTFLIIGALLLLSIVMFFVFQRRFNVANRELKDLTSELGHTRERLTETGQQLEETQVELKNTTNRYQGILFDAKAGMFQMDRNGKCTYINTALQEFSGLYPKKALKEGLPSAVHPEDRDRFKTAWDAFVEKNEPFHIQCRFKHAKGREVHVDCHANKVLNEKKDVESYIGWVSDITPFHEAKLRQEAYTARYAHFIEETIEGYYHLTPESPIPLTESTEKMAKAIMEKMKIAACNDTFASMYGKTATELKGTTVNSLQDGCGPFKNTVAVKTFVADAFRAINLESIRQDPRGNRLNLLNNVIGIVEDNKLVGIWGSQSNISQHKREKAELASQANFMRRILNALPADVHVKDTRCRYLYASKKLADRTGIPQEDWVGKTIFEVMPATPRDHDKNAIEVMKSNKLLQSERPYEAQGKSGWLGTIQAPLVSSEGLVEGVIGLSLDISARKKKEEEVKNYGQQVEQQLNLRTTELQNSQREHGAIAIALRDTNQKLRIREAELENSAHKFKEKLKERKQSEEILRRNEESLLTRQKQLEEQLHHRLTELDQETDKRKKWEELLAIKEDELNKLEKCATTRAQQLEQEIAVREKSETSLSSTQTKLDTTLQELKKLEQEHNHKVAALSEKQKSEIQTEHAARQQAESQLVKTEELLTKTQKQLKELTEQHAAELEHEVTERKTASKKLIQNSEELDELKQQFNLRIEQETKALKQELAQKQIREKALRQHEKDLDFRIKALEKSLRAKACEYQEQIQAREATEVQRSQVEQKLEKLTVRQKELIERETQKLNLNIAEIRLEEVRLRNQVGSLEHANEELENTLETRTSELARATAEQKKLEASLSDTQKKIKQLAADQNALIATETQALTEELKQLQLKEADLLQEETRLKKQSAQLDETIQKLTTDLETETHLRKGREKELNELQVAFDASQENVGELIEKHTKELQETIEQQKKNAEELIKTEDILKKQAATLQETIDTRTHELAEAKQEREKAELELLQTIERSGNSAKEIEAKIAAIKNEHLAEIERIKDEQKEIRQNEKHYRSLFQSSADAFLQINPKDGKIQVANLAAAHLFGEETTSTLNDKTLDALSPKQQLNQSPSLDLAKARLHSTLETGHESFEWEFLKTDKATFTGLVSLSMVEIEEKQLILAVVQDISEIKAQQARLQQCIDEAHAANLINSKIVDEVNEVVQSSLTPVIESSSVIEKSENITVEQKLDMAVINRNCRTLVDMMNYRAELSHVADGTDEAEAAKCDLHELIKDLDQQYCQRAETKKLFFAVSYAQYQSSNNVPKLVETDEKKVRKVLGILLGYALSHTEKGRLGLHAGRKSSEGDMISVAFELAYTGSDEKDELLTRTFGPNHSDHADTEDMKYGLSLARRYVLMLGGNIELEYRQGGVTALVIDFPFKKVASEIVMPGKDADTKAGAA
jgi:PAS domain S-box-containing protein